LPTRLILTDISGLNAMGNDDLGERIAVLETEMKQMKAASSKWTLQELLIFTSVIGTLVAVVAKGLGWTP